MLGMADKTRVLMAVLIAVIVILAGIMVYAFIIKPKVQGYVISGQNQGIQYTLAQIVSTVVNCQTYPISVGNQTIHLIATECLQAAQTTQPAQTTQNTTPPA